jgi:glyoxylase-like metal-dependent hydrolase (beta-lactamase superfamily II)
MKPNRLWLAVLFVGLAGLGLYVAPTEAQPGTLKEIVSGVWFRQGEIDQGHCNNVIIEMKDHLIVVDANFPSGARLVLADAKKVSKKPVKYVFDTHHHGDHAYGNPVWTKMGAITVAHAGVAEELKLREPKRWLETAKSRKDVGELNLPTAEPPKQTFSKSPYVMEDGSRRVELHFFGWAHTRGDGFAYLPKEKVLCTGDAAVNGPYNYTGDANIGNWPNVIRGAQKLDVAHVLPGHGGHGGKEILAGQIQFFVELRKAVEQAVKSGKKLEDVVTMKGAEATATSIKLPESVKNWTGDSLPTQVLHTYKEVSRGKPYGEISAASGE